MSQKYDTNWIGAEMASALLNSSFDPYREPQAPELVTDDLPVKVDGKYVVFPHMFRLLSLPIKKKWGRGWVLDCVCAYCSATAKVEVKPSTPEEEEFIAGLTMENGISCYSAGHCKMDKKKLWEP